MRADRPELTASQEISWRLKELGPELRRALFEKALHPHGAVADAGKSKSKGRPADRAAEPPAAELKEGRR
jgi:hypothetical protein